MPRPTRAHAIVAEATRLFNERGFHATTVRAIAEAAGMNSGGLYVHFSSKEVLLHHIVTETNKKVLDAVSVVQKSNLDPVAKFRAALIAHVSANFEVGAATASRVFLTEWRHLSGRDLEDVLDQRREYEHRWDLLIAEAVGAGAFRSDMDPRVARLVTLSVANWSVMWINPQGEQSVSEIIGKAADELLRGFLAR